MVSLQKDEILEITKSWTSENVKLATTDAEREAIYRFRYEVHVEDMGADDERSIADSAQRQIHDEMDESGLHFYVERNGQLLAALRANLRQYGPLECESELELERFAPAYPDNVSMISWVVLRPELRDSDVLMHMACALFEFGSSMNMSFFDFIMCHPRMIPLYAYLGYRIYKPGFRHPRYSYVVPMVLVMNDIEYLESIKSPFAPLAGSIEATTKYSDLLLREFPDAGQNQAMMDIDPAVFWQLARTRLADPTATIKQVSLFSRLTEDQIKLLTSLGHIVRCKSGDPVLMKGDQGREVFVIMEGSFRVRAQESRGTNWLFKPLTPGDIFGELAFLTNGLRSASVIAVEDGTLLIMQGSSLDKLIDTEPKLATTLFHNMASVVATRMRDSLNF